MLKSKDRLFSLEDAVADIGKGAYTIAPNNNKIPLYNVRALDRYCKEHNIDPSQLNQNELKKFETIDR